MDREELRRRRRELRAVAHELEAQYAKPLQESDAEMEFGVTASKRMLKAWVRWGTNIYDHIDIDLDGPLTRVNAQGSPPVGRRLRKRGSCLKPLDGHRRR